jgi:hypothetical protein
MLHVLQPLWPMLLGPKLRSALRFIPPPRLQFPVLPKPVDVCRFGRSDHSSNVTRSALCHKPGMALEQRLNGCNERCIVRAPHVHLPSNLAQSSKGRDDQGSIERRGLKSLANHAHVRPLDQARFRQAKVSGPDLFELIEGHPVLANDDLGRLATDKRCHHFGIDLIGRATKARLVEALDVRPVQKRYALFSPRHHSGAKLAITPAMHPSLHRSDADVEQGSGFAPQHPLSSVAVVEFLWRHGLNFLPMLAV